MTLAEFLPTIDGNVFVSVITKEDNELLKELWKLDDMMAVPIFNEIKERRIVFHIGYKSEQNRSHALDGMTVISHRRWVPNRHTTWVDIVVSDKPSIDGGSCL